MKSNGECPKCHSTTIIPEVTVVDYSRSQFAGNMQLVFERNPTAIVFKDKLHAALKAWGCGNCGLVELYTDKHVELLEAYQDRLAYTEMGEKEVPNAPNGKTCPQCGHRLTDGEDDCPQCRED